ncbi:hypothetical protein [Gluconobacter kanchanaburiensis]|uniref:Glycosyl transferase n=1 Tax=Gluconobacter kanchanaburiensis NBRC 103587 TaxID=1307948 RepID=A0A511B5X3_9PROT|nr:hypothetical protein [Gluconobacter kanchanaburiensis]MBF0861496.1 hypothetical protein [Gluconobacter kanchanaburiensis]GBR68407.1 hypothetical protein AA103587_0791 [Gluconobacter kanchanaburiensis NBRC 103587]GEK95860.1 hypothetical protein GKA01_10570 [Gluconobacter kanchanaburiensis NBRC 103587]
MTSYSPSPRHVFIATPCFGGTVTLNYMQSLIGCMAMAPAHNLQLTLSTIGNDALITRARNTLLHQFITMTDATHLLFIDSDIGFSIQDILALLDADHPLIGAPYPLKSHYWDHDTDRFMSAGEPASTASLRYVGDCAALHESKTQDDIASISYIGTGFMLMTRQMVLDMIAHYPETRYSRIDAQIEGNTPASASSDAYALFDCLIDPETRTYLSEDFAFCRRWTGMGGAVALHRGLSLTHTGNTTFQGDLSLRTLPLFTSDA